MKAAGHSGRIVALDGMRGLIMVIMALDHAALFIAGIHPEEFWGIHMPAYKGALGFLTRWITHLCAPGFFFLMGAGIVLFAASRHTAGWSQGRITRFFMVRGGLLVLMQLLIENPAWLLGAGKGEMARKVLPGGGDVVMIHLGVLYGLGISMMVIAILRRAPGWCVALVSAGAILAPQVLLPGAESAALRFTPWLRMLLIPGQTGIMQCFYPLLPWVGITGLGVLFGRALQKDRESTMRSLPLWGGVGLAAFIGLRVGGGFGNFHAAGEGWTGFLAVTKYPPSLAFILLTLGINSLLLFALSRMGPWLNNRNHPLTVFGRSALFFYLIHLYLYGLTGLLFHEGVSWGILYLVWIAGLVILYPLCRSYGTFKRRRALDSIWRFF